MHEDSYLAASTSHHRWTRLLCTPPRSPSTTALTMQLAMPSPVMAGSYSLPGSRAVTPRPVSPPPSNPLRPPYRPPSRSERLLRDTLRRAEEQDRRLLPFVDPEDSNRPMSDDDADEGLSIWSIKSKGRSRSNTASSVAPSFHRTRTAPGAVAPVTIPFKAGHRSSHSSYGSPPNSRPQACTPHEAVLRNRLETVLTRATTTQSSPDRRRSSTSAANQPPRIPRCSAPTPVPPAEWSIWETNQVSPLTPPPTPPSPPFDARSANAACRAMHGYVSFADVEGLNVDEPDEDVMKSESPLSTSSTASDGSVRSWWWPWSSQSSPDMLSKA